MLFENLVASLVVSSKEIVRVCWKILVGFVQSHPYARAARSRTLSPPPREEVESHRSIRFAGRWESSVAPLV